MSGNPTPSAAPGGTSLTSAAVRGSVMNSGQWLVNKVATAAAMLVIARFLSPDDYGVASQSLAIAQFVVVLTPLTIGDVLIAHPRRFEALVPSARALALMVGAGMGLLVLAALPVALFAYSKYPAAWLGGLLAVLALRPVLDALLVIPVSRLRINLEYRRIAMIDGLVQLAMTTASLAMAVLGSRGAALVVPQVVGTGIRDVAYGRHGGRKPWARVHRTAMRALMRGFVPAALAQYVHNVVVMLEVLVLGILAGDFQTGLFGFAFTLAAQANSVVAYQLGVVLQPIFGRLQDDPPRQVSAFLRAQRVLGAVCIPLSITQAIVAEPLFRIAFDPKWLPAVPVFQAISLGQSFYFATGPSISCLRSQRRFTTFFVWQGVQAILSVGLYALGSRWDGAFGVAVASGIGWGISAPTGVLLCLRADRGRNPLQALRVFVGPWLVSAAPAALALLGVRWLAGFGRMGDIASLVTVAPIFFAISVSGAVAADSEARALVLPRVRGVVSRLRGRR